VIGLGRTLRLGMPTLMECKTVRENLEIARDLNMDFLELNINMLYCTPTEEFRHELLALKKEFKIDFTMHYYDTLDISSNSKHYRNYLYTDFSEIGKYLEGIVEKIVLHLEPGAYMTIHSEKHYVYSADETYVARTVNTIKTIREILHTFGIKVVLENVPIHPFMEELYKELNNYGFMFCYDIGHDVIYHDYLYQSFLKKYKLFVSHMHMHNVYNKKDHQELTKGELFIPNYIEYAISNNVDVVIEVKDLENLKKSVAYIQDYYDIKGR